MTGPTNIGLDLQSKSLRPCGLCGVLRVLSRTHVPPQAAGNTGRVTRAPIRSHADDAVLGRPSKGGLWVRGLCERCNNLAGNRYDAAYSDFANMLRAYTGPARRLLIDERATPGVRFAPGLVSRSILFGMHAVSPNLRRLFPAFARQLLDEDDELRLPTNLRLKVALTPGPTARIAGPIHARRVLHRPGDLITFGEVFFPPLAWVLSPSDSRTLPDVQNWADASEWPLYSPHAIIDLRDVARRIPLIRHPLHTDPDSWIYMFSDEITPILEGNLSP
jgi:hypothetical protein